MEFEDFVDFGLRCIGTELLLSAQWEERRTRVEVYLLLLTEPLSNDFILPRITSLLQCEIMCSSCDP